MRRVALVVGWLAVAGSAMAGDFEKVVVTTRPNFLSNRTEETITVEADGTCWYKITDRPARGDQPGWPAATLKHKLDAEKLRRLTKLLRETDWLGKTVPPGPPRLDADEQTVALTRDGRTTTLACPDGAKPYQPLLDFFQAIADQEYLLYRLTWGGFPQGVKREAVRELDLYIQAEMGGMSSKPPLEFDYTRFVPWAVGLVRKPFDQPTPDIEAAVRLVGFLRLTAEWDKVARLASDRDRTVREMVVLMAARLAGDKAIPVLRDSLDNTSAGAWELVELGPAAVPAIVKVIRSSQEQGWLSGEGLVRAYIEHWKDVPKPLDPEVVDAVRAAIHAANGNAFMRTTYHEELLHLVEERTPQK